MENDNFLSELKGCAEHGKPDWHRWGCPECVRELRENESKLKLQISKLQIDLEISEKRQAMLLDTFAQLQMNLNKIGIEIGED